MSDDDIKPLPTWKEQDVADGRAIRGLREALPEGWSAVIEVRASGTHVGEVWTDDARLDCELEGGTVEEVADACRDWLESHK